MKIAYLLENPPGIQDRFAEDIDHVILIARPDKSYSPEDLARLADVDGIIPRGQATVTEEVLAASPRCKIVQRTGVGYEGVDLEAAARRGIPCCNLAGVNKGAVAEHGFMLLLAVAKNLFQNERLTRELRWPEAKGLGESNVELAGKTLGIVGLGDTGYNLARRARAFDMQILYNDIREIDAKLVEEVGARFTEKDDLYAASDFISINATRNPTTVNLIDASALAKMKPGIVLVCCARGGIVDEAAVTEALNSGHLAGAGFDVFSTEPMLADNPLLKAKNTVLTSHVAGGTREAWERSFEWAHENVRRVVERREKPLWVVNGV